MCTYFSCVSTGNGKPHYFDAKQREKIKAGKLKGPSGNRLSPDSHASIQAYYKLGWDNCNCYEYNPFYGGFRVDFSGAKRDDSKQIEKWCKRHALRKTASPNAQKLLKLRPPKKIRRRLCAG